MGSLEGFLWLQDPIFFGIPFGEMPQGAMFQGSPNSVAHLFTMNTLFVEFYFYTDPT